MACKDASSRTPVATGLACLRGHPSVADPPALESAERSPHQTPLPCGKICGCKGHGPEFVNTDRLVGLFQKRSKAPKAMFLSWLTLERQGRRGTAGESVLSSQNMRFAHYPKGCNPHP